MWKNAQLVQLLGTYVLGVRVAWVECVRLPGKNEYLLNKIYRLTPRLPQLNFNHFQFLERKQLPSIFVRPSTSCYIPIVLCSEIPT